MSKDNTKIKVSDYGDMLAKIKDMELISYEEFGGYQGKYIAILKDKDRIFYYIGFYGSCSGCDWLAAEQDWRTGEVEYKDALDYCSSMTPTYIVPIGTSLEFYDNNGYDYFKVKNITYNPPKES